MSELYKFWEKKYKSDGCFNSYIIPSSTSLMSVISGITTGGTDVFYTNIRLAVSNQDLLRDPFGIVCKYLIISSGLFLSIHASPMFITRGSIWKPLLPQISLK